MPNYRYKECTKVTGRIPEERCEMKNISHRHITTVDKLPYNKNNIFVNPDQTSDIIQYSRSLDERSSTFSYFAKESKGNLIKLKSNTECSIPITELQYDEKGVFMTPYPSAYFKYIREEKDEEDEEDDNKGGKRRKTKRRKYTKRCRVTRHKRRGRNFQK